MGVFDGIGPAFGQQQAAGVQTLPAANYGRILKLEIEARDKAEEFSSRITALEELFRDAERDLDCRVDGQSKRVDELEQRMDDLEGLKRVGKDVRIRADVITVWRPNSEVCDTIGINSDLYRALYDIAVAARDATECGLTFAEGNLAEAMGYLRRALAQVKLGEE